LALEDCIFRELPHRGYLLIYRWIGTNIEYKATKDHIRSLPKSRRYTNTSQSIHYQFFSVTLGAPLIEAIRFSWTPVAHADLIDGAIKFPVTRHGLVRSKQGEGDGGSTAQGGEGKTGGGSWEAGHHNEEVTPLVVDDREEGAKEKWMLVGKVLFRSVFHIHTISAALHPTWGNPKGLFFLYFGENCFIAEFATKRDRDRVWEGPPWHVSKKFYDFERI
jgi:hypothetical protein